LDRETGANFWGRTFEDIFEAYMNHNDCYDEAKMVSYYDLLPEGTYCFCNDKIDITVKTGDIVVDAGSWIGEFAAYASVKGAITYAFEPSKAMYNYLLKTAKLNPNIYPAQKGLGAEKFIATLSEDEIARAGSAIVIERSSFFPEQNSVEMTTIDAFVEENNLKRVDFIKADIEGYERYMLEGAKETLKKFAPKLAICTYHRKDDPQVLAKIIQEANPAYYILQKRKKLYAAIPENRKTMTR
jgi:FkbM family methyltransferase